MNRERAPLVTVVCLCYNQQDTVGQTIESIVTQKTDFPFELIVHDDASTDRSPEIIRAWAEKYPDIIVPILQSENQYHRVNIAETWLTPMHRGKYVAICEGDDYWTSPDKLAVQTAAMEADPEITLSFHAVTELRAGGETRVFRPVKETGYVPPQQVIRRGGMFCPTVSIMVRRDIADDWPAFRKMADVYDYPLQALAAARGKIYYIDMILGAYRFAMGDSWTAQRKRETDTAHVAAETAWLAAFDTETDGRFHAAVSFHLAHLWLTEYRKTFDKTAKEKTRAYAAALPAKEKAAFRAALCFFGAFRGAGNRMFEGVKRRLLK